MDEPVIGKEGPAEATFDPVAGGVAPLEPTDGGVGPAVAVPAETKVAETSDEQSVEEEVTVTVYGVSDGGTATTMVAVPAALPLTVTVGSPPLKVNVIGTFGQLPAVLTVKLPLLPFWVTVTVAPEPGP